VYVCVCVGVCVGGGVSWGAWGCVVVCGGGVVMYVWKEGGGAGNL
jgi:hypothetical protein